MDSVFSSLSSGVDVGPIFSFLWMNGVAFLLTHKLVSEAISKAIGQSNAKCHLSFNTTFRVRTASSNTNSRTFQRQFVIFQELKITFTPV